MGENNTGASLCRRRTGGGGGRGGGEKKQKKKQATQTAPVLLLLDETTSCLREEEPAITIAFAPKMTIHCSRVNPEEDHQFTARGLDYSSRRSSGAARNHSINLATSPRSARSPEKKQKKQTFVYALKRKTNCLRAEFPPSSSTHTHTRTRASPPCCRAVRVVTLLIPAFTL